MSSRRWSDVRAFVGRPIDLPHSAVAAARAQALRATAPAPADAPPSITLRNDGTQALDSDPISEKQGWDVLAITAQAGQSAEEMRVVFVEVQYGVAAGVGALLIVFALPFLFMAGKNPWYQLLSEGDQGLSLGRVQLVLWFAPAVFIYAALSIPLLRMAPLDPTLSALLGLGGFTTLLSTAASTPPTAAAGEGATTMGSLSDLVTDFQNHTDFTRYQYLAVSALGSASLFVAFVTSMTMPAVPKEFLYMVAASQAAYVGTKAVKATRSPAAPVQAALPPPVQAAPAPPVQAPPAPPVQAAPAPPVPAP